jgi:hypothetical protein
MVSSQALSIAGSDQALARWVCVFFSSSIWAWTFSWPSIGEKTKSLPREKSQVWESTRTPLQSTRRTWPCRPLRPPHTANTPPSIVFACGYGRRMADAPPSVPGAGSTDPTPPVAAADAPAPVAVGGDSTSSTAKHVATAGATSAPPLPPGTMSPGLTAYMFHVECMKSNTSKASVAKVRRGAT